MGFCLYGTNHLFMETPEHAGVKGPNRHDLSRRVLAGILVMGLLGVGLIVGLIRLLSPTASKHAHVVPPPFVDVRPVGVIAYSIRHGARVATLNREGFATACFDGSADISLLDLAGGLIVYADHQQVLAVPLERCAGKAQVLATYRQLTGHRPTEGDGFRCASLSPNGDRIAMSLHSGFGNEGVWVQQVDGSAKHFIKGFGACGWVDNGHLLSANFEDGAEFDHFAIDASTGKASFLANPDAWGGSRSPDGRLALYETYRSDTPATYVLDRATRQLRRFSVKGYSVDGNPASDSVWNHDASRFLVSDDSGTFIFASAGSSPLKVDLPGSNPTTGWFSDHELWFLGPSTINLLDLGTGATQGVFMTDLDSGESSVKGLQIMISAERQGGLLREDALTHVEAAPLDSIPALNAHFRRPPSWTVVRCRRCDLEGYQAGWTVQNESADVAPQVWFASTSDSVTRAIDKILRHSGALEPCNRKTQACIDYETKSVTLSGVRFTEVTIDFFEDSETIYVGRMRNETVLIRGLFYDPSESVVLDSLSFG